MKTIKSIVVMLMLAIATSASAQTESSANVTSDSVGWTNIFVQYNMPNIDPKYGDNVDFDAFSVGISRTFSASKVTPIFFEVGGALRYSFTSEDGEVEIGGYVYDTEVKIKMLSINAPVNLLYSYRLPNSPVHINPYVGLNLRFNLQGKYRIEVGGESEEFNLFDKEDMNEIDSKPWKRFQIGWQMGMNVHFNNRWYLGISYGSDFSEIASDCKMSTTSLTLGYGL